MKRKPVIAFIGIDGAGKTTLINKVAEKMEEKGHKYKIVYMGLGGEGDLLFHHLSNFKRKILYNKKGADTKKLDNYRERGILWVFVQYIELWLRYLNAKKYSKDYMILFDRFFYDGLILGNRLSFHIFKFFTPKPDRCFLIKAPPKVVYGRKKEAGIKEIKKYYKKAENLSHFFPIITINNTKKINDVADKIYLEIYKKNNI